MHPLAIGILDKNVRALARGISYIENNHNERLTLLKDLHAHKNKAFKLGITGAPGAGKSSLVNRLITHLRKQQRTVGIVAVDPTSPFSGGAILGDRVRMSNHFTDPDVYIRSMSTRGSLGGLARATKEAVHLLDAFGKDVIIIETVGVGQTELDIMNVADTTAVVLTPNGGDTVQAFKAGIMEIADLYIINKADLHGADKLKAEIDHMLDLVKHDAKWRPPIVKTVSIKNEGIADIWQQVDQHRSFLLNSGEGRRREQDRVVEEMQDVLENLFLQFTVQKLDDEHRRKELEAVRQGTKDPYTVAQEWFHSWIKNGAGENQE